MLNLIFESAGYASRSVRDQHFGGFKCLPYNRFRTAGSETWWITPGCERIAFPYAKAIFTTHPDWKGDGDIFCGLNVEKGLCHVSNLPQSNVMDAGWYWNAFVDRKQLSLESVLGEARQHTVDDLQVYVASFMPEGSEEWEVLWLQVEGRAVKQTEYRQTDGTLSGVASVTDLSAFVDELGKLNHAGWHWVDVMIGQSFSLDQNGPDDSARCGAMLKAFKPWMRKSAVKAS